MPQGLTVNGPNVKRLRQQFEGGRAVLSTNGTFHSGKVGHPPIRQNQKPVLASPKLVVADSIDSELKCRTQCGVPRSRTQGWNGSADTIMDKAEAAEILRNIYYPLSLKKADVPQKTENNSQNVMNGESIGHSSGFVAPNRQALLEKWKQLIKRCGQLIEKEEKSQDLQIRSLLCSLNKNMMSFLVYNYGDVSTSELEQNLQDWDDKISLAESRASNFPINDFRSRSAGKIDIPVQEARECASIRQVAREIKFIGKPQKNDVRKFYVDTGSNIPLEFTITCYVPFKTDTMKRISQGG